MAKFNPPEPDAEPSQRSPVRADPGDVLQMIYTEMLGLKHALAVSESARREAEARVVQERDAGAERLAEERAENAKRLEGVVEKLEAALGQQTKVVDRVARRISDHVVKQMNEEVLPSIQSTAKEMAADQLAALGEGVSGVKAAGGVLEAAQEQHDKTTRANLARVTDVRSEVGRVLTTLARARWAIYFAAVLGCGAFAMQLFIALLGMAHLLGAQPTSLGSIGVAALLLAVVLGVTWTLSGRIANGEMR